MLYCLSEMMYKEIFNILADIMTSFLMLFSLNLVKYSLLNSMCEIYSKNISAETKKLSKFYFLRFFFTVYLLYNNEINLLFL